MDPYKILVNKLIGDVIYKDGDYFAFDVNAQPLASKQPVRQKFNGYVNFTLMVILTFPVFPHERSRCSNCTQ